MAEEVNPGSKREERIGPIRRVLRFIQEVRSEVSKVVWPTRREVLITTAMVFVMATLTAIFFFFVDWLIRTGLNFVLGVAG